MIAYQKITFSLMSYPSQTNFSSSFSSLTHTHKSHKMIYPFSKIFVVYTWILINLHKFASPAFLFSILCCWLFQVFIHTYKYRLMRYSWDFTFFMLEIFKPFLFFLVARSLLVVFADSWRLFFEKFYKPTRAHEVND